MQEQEKLEIMVSQNQLEMSLKSEINIYKIDIYPREGMTANEQ